MTHSASDFRAYRDFTAWERDWRGFIVNERPIVQRLAEPTPLLTLKPDRALIALFREHRRMPDPTEGGDLVLEHRLATHGPSGTARVITRYAWSNPMAYTMTLSWQLPNALDWLWPVLRAGGCWCALAPRLDLGMLWLPAPDELAAHLIMVAAFLRVPRGRG